MLVRPVKVGAAFEARARVAIQSSFSQVVVFTPSLLFCQLPRQQGDRFSEQIIGIFDRAATENWLGINGGFEGAFEQPTLFGLLDTLAKDGLDLVMDHQVRAKELKGALGAEWFTGVTAQDRSPAKIEGSACHRLFVGNLIVLCKNEHQCQIGRGYAGPATLY